jgi:acetoin utilization deacetylase AcuC-like enzyme
MLTQFLRLIPTCYKLAHIIIFMKIVFSPECLEYGGGGHPESPERVKRIYEAIKDKYEFVRPAPCSDKELELVHSKALIEKVRRQDPSVFDSDTPNYQGIFNYAKLSVGAAIRAMELALKREKAFSLMRPPGHHSGRDFLGGFCYFNNIAIAVKKALERVGKAAILDIDCHHGNGTQDIFLGRPGVLYVSIHQSPLYPGTGLRSEGNCINFPIPPHTGEREYLSVLEKAIKQIREFGPEFLGVSAGFDTYRGDPLTQMGLEKESYGRIGEIISGLGLPGFAVLEGGYSREIGECVRNFLNGYGS